MKMHLVALLSVIALVAPVAAVAKDHHQQQPYYGYGSGFNGYNQGQNESENDNDNDNEQGDRDEDGNGNQGRGNPQNCVNPAGHQRGWCKQHHRGDNNCNGYNNNNGYPTATPTPYNNNCYNNGNRNGNVVLHGVITSVNGNTVTMLQGLTTISFNDSLAYQYGRVNGSLYPTRSITVNGYYDNNGYFQATSIN